MIPIILILITTVIIAIIIDKPWDAFDYITDVWFGLMLGGLVVAFYLAIQCTTNIAEPVEQQISEPLVNIADTSYPDTHGSIRGGLFYIYGSISTDNKQAFNYYVKQADGSFKLKSAPASDSTIIYAKDNPRVEISAYKCERGKIIFEAWSISGCEEKPTTYKFYIPEGSITESYALGGKE
jgi:hypothetical protein